MSDNTSFTEHRAYLQGKMERNLVPFIKKFGFVYEIERRAYSDAFVFKSHATYILFEVLGFHPHDYPWTIDARLGREGFKKTTTEFDYVYLSYFKEKISPREEWQREAMKLSFDGDSLNTFDQIDKTVEKLHFDLDTFCKDFLTGEFTRFERIREIRYLEHLVRTEVFGEYDRDGGKTFRFYQNKEVE